MIGFNPPDWLVAIAVVADIAIASTILIVAAVSLAAETSEKLAEMDMQQKVKRNDISRLQKLRAAKGDNPAIVEWLRERLLALAGVHPKIEAPKLSFKEILRAQWSAKFERLMRNRMAMGFFRYGPLREQIGKNKYDNLSNIEARLKLYKKDLNREHLVDIANLCMVEFVVHPEYPFKPNDDSLHVKTKGIS